MRPSPMVQLLKLVLCCAAAAAAAAGAAAAGADGGGGASCSSGGAACRSGAGDGSGRGIVDLTVPVAAGLPVWDGGAGLPRNWRSLSEDQHKGDVCTKSWLNFDAHTGTHMDAPSHFLDLEGGGGIETLPLHAMVGPAVVVEVPRDTNVTAAALAALDIPEAAERLLFRTANTDRGLMARRAFVTDFVGLDSGAARWLAKERPGVVLVGIDYLTIGMMDDIVEAHKELFRKGTVIVEGLNLTGIPAGVPHHLTCLPLRLVGSDGSPARCILAPL